MYDSKRYINNSDLRNKICDLITLKKAWNKGIGDY